MPSSASIWATLSVCRSKAGLTCSTGTRVAFVCSRAFLMRGNFGMSRQACPVPSAQGVGMNCFALLSRDNRCLSAVTETSIDAAWISQKLDQLSLSLRRLTVVVLDNARVHTKAVKDRSWVWQERGLFVWFLPTYSPHLNIAEVLWRKLKYEWLRAEDYSDAETLHYAVWQALSAVGKSLRGSGSPYVELAGSVVRLNRLTQ